MLGSAQLPALHHRAAQGSAQVRRSSRPAGGVRIPCTFESDRRQRARATLCNISPVDPVAVSWPRGRTHAREAVAWERALRRAFPPRRRLPCQYDLDRRTSPPGRARPGPRGP
eukprot:tig00000350_g24303.t1